MNAEAVDRIAAQFLRKPAQIGDLVALPADWTLNDPNALIKPGPQAKSLELKTLGSLRDYLKANRDALDLSKVVVHVASPTQVMVAGPLDERARSREYVINATAEDTAADFTGKFHTIKDFLIGLQTRFVDADDRANVLRVLGTVKDENVRTAQDDGVSQTVTAKAGIALVADVTVPNPVTLVPYSTFRDILQPPRKFVLRVNQGKPGELPSVALFEADAGTWKLPTIGRIADWLKEQLEGVGVAILA